MIRYWYPSAQSAFQHYWSALPGSDRRYFSIMSIVEQLGHDHLDRIAYPDGDRRDKRTKALVEQKPKWYGELDSFIMKEMRLCQKEREKETGIKWHVDHIVPLCGDGVSGLHCYLNWQLIPAHLNMTKNSRSVYTEPLEWLSDAT